MHAIIWKKVFIALFSYSLMLKGENLINKYLVEHNLFERNFISFLEETDGLF